MNQHAAVEVEDMSGSELRLRVLAQPGMTPMRDSKVLAGPVRQSGGVARFFTW